MFRIMSLTAAAALAASSAAAFQSDRYFDQRLDTSVTAPDFTVDTVATTQIRYTRPATFSGKNDKPRKKPYAYINPYGIGPYNDSR